MGDEMTYHEFKNQDGRCRCRWCGALCRGSSPVTACSVDYDMRSAICHFAAQYGRQWRIILSRDWSYRVNMSLALEEARRQIGIEQLWRITDKVLRRHRNRCIH